MSVGGPQVRVSFAPLGIHQDVVGGTLLDEAARAAGAPLAQACRGAGVCGRCAVHVEGPIGGLTPPEAAELATLRRQGIPSGQRLGCCARVVGDVCISTTYW